MNPAKAGFLPDSHEVNEITIAEIRTFAICQAIKTLFMNKGMALHCKEKERKFKTHTFVNISGHRRKIGS